MRPRETSSARCHVLDVQARAMDSDDADDAFEIPIGNKAHQKRAPLAMEDDGAGDELALAAASSSSTSSAARRAMTQKQREDWAVQAALAAAAAEGGDGELEPPRGGKPSRGGTLRTELGKAALADDEEDVDYFDVNYYEMDDDMDEPGGPGRLVSARHKEQQRSHEEALRAAERAEELDNEHEEVWNTHSVHTARLSLPPSSAAVL